MKSVYISVTTEEGELIERIEVDDTYHLALPGHRAGLLETVIEAVNRAKRIQEEGS